MIKTILVPIDISSEKAGATALKLAGDMAEKYGSAIVLLNVIEPVPGYVAAELPEGFQRKTRTDAVARLEALARDSGMGGSAKIEVRDGHPSTEILEHARECAADMIVIASHDPGFADYLLGSVAARIVRHAHCSVLVARNLDL